MPELRTYRTRSSDNTRWKRFEYRAGDIVVCTPPKSGTTWMQTLCAMLVLDKVEFDEPLTQISPYLDMLTTPIDDLLERLEAQSHRRIIKTHTPLDGLPLDDRATYICVARDPRDVGVSMDHHLANIDDEQIMKACEDAVGPAGASGFVEAEPRPDDPRQRFWAYVEGAGGNQFTLEDVFVHLGTVWAARHRRNVHLFHYGDLLADLPGELRRLASVLDIELGERKVDLFAEAGTFSSMRSRSSTLTPHLEQGIWHDAASFFHRGTNGQWQTLLDERDERYWARVDELAEPDLAAWAHLGARHP